MAKRIFWGLYAGLLSVIIVLSAVDYLGHPIIVFACADTLAGDDNETVEGIWYNEYGEPIGEDEPIVEDVIQADSALDANHPLMETPFDDYTVTEGILLLLLICMYMLALINIAKGVFSIW